VVCRPAAHIVQWRLHSRRSSDNNSSIPSPNPLTLANLAAQAATVIVMTARVKQVPGATQIVVQIPKHSHYPLEPALVTLRNDKLPTHVMLAITAALNLRARESSGDPVSGAH
jgi:hypothetical protein